jgi:hypothetical protein
MVKNKEIGLTSLYEMVETSFPWFRPPVTRYFCCGHCDARARDANLLNRSCLPIWLVINEETDRRYNFENEHSRDATNRVASTLPPEQWLPSFEVMQEYCEMQKSVSDQDVLDEDGELRLMQAWNRLKNTQPQYVVIAAVVGNRPHALVTCYSIMSEIEKYATLWYITFCQQTTHNARFSIFAGVA